MRVIYTSDRASWTGLRAAREPAAGGRLHRAGDRLPQLHAGSPMPTAWRWRSRWSSRRSPIMKSCARSSAGAAEGGALPRRPSWRSSCSLSSAGLPSSRRRLDSAARQPRSSSSIASTWRTGRRRVAQSQWINRSRSTTSWARSRDASAFRITARRSSSPPIPRAFRSCCAITGRARTASMKRSSCLRSSDQRSVRDRRTRVDVNRLSEGLVRVTARFGFMEKLDIGRITHACAMLGLHIGGDDTTTTAPTPRSSRRRRRPARAAAQPVYRFAAKLAPGHLEPRHPADALAKLGMEVPM